MVLFSLSLEEIEKALRYTIPSCVINKLTKLPAMKGSGSARDRVTALAVGVRSVMFVITAAIFLMVAINLDLVSKGALLISKVCQHREDSYRDEVAKNNLVAKRANDINTTAVKVNVREFLNSFPVGT